MPHNPSIHGLRGLAILIVLMLHLYQAVQTGGFNVELPRESAASHALAVGNRGVDLFFMISGYLIVASLLRYRNPGRFLIQRTVRIYPAFLLPHLLIFAIGPWIGYAWFRGIAWDRYAIHFLSNLLMLPGFFELPIGNIVAWSLSLEMVFYVLAAAGLAISKARWPRPLKALLWAAWLAAVLWSLYRRPRGWFFVVGVLAFFLDRRWGDGPALPGLAGILWAEPGFRRDRVWASVLRLIDACSGALALLLFCVLFEPAFPAALVFGLIAFFRIVRQRDLISGALQVRGFQYLGEISYSFYLWHIIVLYGMKRVFGRSGGIFPNGMANLLAFLFLSVTGSLVVAHLSHRLVERWFTDRFLRRRLESRAVKVQPAAPPLRLAA